ncbi:hypothetical protein L1987_23936 [Smallanthus sonchifolius]|uniref:Uncharacterized protein n=1 Tax=Smallanthus sonchifolius TaxID=185202 RepID=A0ACB9IJN1_9ASTR|nr:hypothetical protein L1987_23936 [Smallanthus sonchifolius]
MQKVIDILEATRKKSGREKALAEVKRSPFLLRGIELTKGFTKEDEEVYNYLFKEDGNKTVLFKTKGTKIDEGSVDIVFKSRYDVEAAKFIMRTLKLETKVYNSVIDAWAEVLNYEEKFREPSSSNRLFCGTNVIMLRHVMQALAITCMEQCTGIRNCWI